MPECREGPAPSGTKPIPSLSPSLVRIRASAIGANCNHVGFLLPFLLFQRFSKRRDIDTRNDLCRRRAGFPVMELYEREAGAGCGGIR